MHHSISLKSVSHLTQTQSVKTQFLWLVCEIKFWANNIISFIVEFLKILKLWETSSHSEQYSLNNLYFTTGLIFYKKVMSYLLY
jgi:hypothetical protein